MKLLNYERKPNEMTKADLNTWAATATNEWLDACFYDDESGELFFVELRKDKGEEMEDFIARCNEIATENFDAPTFIKLVDSGSAETLGYDTY